MLYGTSAIGEPPYAGAIYSPDPEVPLDAPVVELGLTYDPTPAPTVKAWAIPPWLVLVGVTAWALNRWGAGPRRV